MPIVSEKKDDKLKKILVCIATTPCISSFKIAGTTGIPRNVVVRKIKRYELINERILKQEENFTGKRKANLFSITFKGIIYALNVGAIKPEQAAKFRKRSSIEGPFDPDPIIKRLHERNDFRSLMAEVFGEESEAASEGEEKFFREYVEAEFSKEIYTELLKRVNLNYYEEDDARYVFQRKYQECFIDLWERIFKKGDKEAFVKLAKTVKKPIPSEKELAEAIEIYEKHICGTGESPGKID